MKKLAMVQLDVFTERALTGNALAVCLDGRGLSTEQMQALARETNLSETTFILPGDAAAEKERGILNAWHAKVDGREGDAPAEPNLLP